MKRYFALLLALCLLLCSCGKDTPPETTPPTEEPTTVPTTVPTEPETEPATEPETEPTEPPVILTHPITGEPLDEPFTGRPVASTLNNISHAMPQSGIGQADWLFEIETEGGITRCMGVFTDLDNVGNIGPVRSARTYFVNLSAAFDSPLAHCGGSPHANAKQYTPWNDIMHDYRDIDEMYHGSYFFRDKERRSQGYALEHTLFTSGEKLKTAMEEMGYNIVKDENGVDYGLLFDANATLDGDPATEITIRFQGGKKTGMTYNDETGLYEASQYGGSWIDANYDGPIAVRNVTVVYADQTQPQGYQSFYDMLGSGDGFVATGGKIVPVKWHRESVYDAYTFTYEDGTPVVLGVGRSYTAIIDPNGSVTFS